MKFGVILPNYGDQASFDNVRQAALVAERLGYGSVWATDHVLVPRENTNPYGNILEAITTLAMLGSITEQVQLGTSVLILPMRNPIIVAKQIATLDMASQGRVILGVSVGWNETEYASLGAEFKTRGRRLDEEIALLRALWRGGQVHFEGKYYRISDGVFMPRPSRPDGIPIWIGGNTVPSLRRVARLGDGWQPTGPSADEVAQGAKTLRELGPARPLTISARLLIDLRQGVPSTYQYRGAARHKLAGNVVSVRERVREYAQAGVEHLALAFPSDPAVALAQMGQFVREIMPEFG